MKTEDRGSIAGWRDGLAAARHAAENGDKPQYGGALEIGTVYVTLSALSWDPADWNWKLNHDTGLFYEQLFAADLSKSKQNGGKHPLHRRRLAAVRRDPRRAGRELGVGARTRCASRSKLRKGVMFPEKPGVMKKRELTADDVVFTYNRLEQEPEEDRGLLRPRREGRGDRQAHRRLHLQGLHRRMGLPLRLGLLLGASMPKEVGDAGATNWKNVNGTGPLHADRLRAGQLQHLHQEPELLGQGEDRRRRSTSCRSSTRSPTAPSRTRRRSSPRCAPASSTCSRRSAGRASTSSRRARRSSSGTAGSTSRAPSWRCASTSTARSTTSACAARSTWRSTSRRSSRPTTTATPSCSPIRSIPTTSATSSRSRSMPASVKELFTYDPGQGQEAAGRGGLSQGLHLQGPGLLLQPRPHGPAAAGRRLPRAGRRQDRDPADGVRAPSCRR